MTETLVFRLDGVMASWGEVTTGVLRSTLAHPTRSAILGLLGAALGIRRDQEERLEDLRQGLRFAVAVAEQGQAMTDFQTTERHGLKRNECAATRRDELRLLQRGDNPNVSRRTYWCDVSYLVALWLEAKLATTSLEGLEQALKRPRFTLSLGRKCCPLSRPASPRCYSVASIEEAFSEYLRGSDSTAIPGERTIGGQIPVYFDLRSKDSDLPERFLPELGERVWRRDLPRKGFRAFAQRAEGRGLVSIGGSKG